MSKLLKNVRGGGLHYVADFTSTETQMFRGGLRHLPEYNEKLIYGTRDTPLNYHDKLSYDRGTVTHSRSPSNQYLNFHYLYGGFRTFFWDRWFMNHWYRKNLRNWWLPVLIWYTFGAFTMRLYDNAAHDYFYFSD